MSGEGVTQNAKPTSERLQKERRTQLPSTMSSHIDTTKPCNHATTIDIHQHLHHTIELRKEEG
jgi:hypothetical protein